MRSSRAEEKKLKRADQGTSLVVQQLRLLEMQRAWVQSLVRGLEPTYHN